jgi:uncharacterized protein (DUF1800 family)
MASGGVSSRERVAHVVRRLSMGPHPSVVAGLHDTDAAVTRALDLSAPAPAPLAFPAPADYDSARDLTAIGPPIAWWFGRMASPDRMIEERLVWFWHDHFATSLAKVRVPYLMWQQHVTLRQHATGNFADLLKAVAKDPAMLVYLDGITNAAQSRNENFGRECLELFTLGRDGGYTQDDVVAASRSFTGWVVDIPGRVASRVGSPWNAVFVPRRHDSGTKTLLGKTGAFDMDGALDVVLGNPSTAAFVATKLYRELVGLDPSDATVDRLAKAFRRDYQIMPLVQAIVQDGAFTSDAAVRAKYRTPVEKLVAILQATGTDGIDLGRVRPGVRQQARGGALATALRTLSYLPFLPPNVGGYPKGARLVGPGNLVHSFDLLQAVATPPTTHESVDHLFARFGLYDVSDQSRAVLSKQRSPGIRIALAVASPEFTLV